jgi:radical SAM superfamily enzyme YgiQ (UPF0313 family)
MAAQQVALVGPGQQENIALGYLGASAEAAGHQVFRVRFDTARDTDAAVAEIVAANPQLVGLGIAFQYAIEAYARLAEKLRARGYTGHITCGGHVPTFCYESLLEDVPAIDSVVRHEGELTLVEMLNALDLGARLRQIAGLVWREGDRIVVGPVRPPVADLDTLPPPLRRDEALVTGGIPIAFVIASRGCLGECAYCSIRAFGKDAGGPGLRLRRPATVADEIAALHHRSGVCIVLLQDDLFILPDERDTVDRMGAITAALRERDVNQMAFWIKGRPETITQKVLEAARKMGVIHIFLGVENASLGRLRYLGRRHTPADNRRALRLCQEHDIGPSFNFMLFDPDCSLHEIEETVDFARTQLKAPWNICRTEVYPGTRLFKRLERQGRLTGDYRSYGYTMTDLRAELCFRILRVAFEHRSFATRSLHNQLITLSFTRQVHRTFLDDAITAQAGAEVDSLVRQVLLDTVDELRRVIGYVRTADVNNAARSQDFAVDLAMGINEKDHRWLAQVEHLTALFDARGALMPS